MSMLSVTSSRLSGLQAARSGTRAARSRFGPDGRDLRFRLIVSLFWPVVTAALQSCVAGESPGYNREIRPILMEACFACHGPDSAARKADLRLDEPEIAAARGAIVPGQPDASEMIRRILSEDPDQVMPPPALKKELTFEQKQTLVAWVQAGAQYEPHWSLIAPVRPQVPPVPETAAEYADWPSNAIDNFILQRLLSEGLAPAAEADRARLARRVSLDLTGLPPAPALLQSFLSDASEDAWETLVDKLLASDGWGEHRGRYWLDYARYADTHGLHFDNFREMWSYRDWVIRAFNRNLAFDQFTVESLAGDLLPHASLDQQIASGFNRCNMTTNEGGIIDEEYAVLYARDRTETVAQVWLGLTAGCAVCHSHKFDPLSQREFYQMAAFFNNTTQAVRDGNIRDTPPIVVVPREEDRGRFAELPGLITDVTGRLAAQRERMRPEFDAWLQTASGESLGEPVSGGDLHLRLRLDEGSGREVLAQVDQQSRPITLGASATWRDGPEGPGLAVGGVVCEFPEAGRFDVHDPFTCAAWIHLPASDSHGAICGRIDSDNHDRGWDFWMAQRRIGLHLVHAWPGQALKVVSRAQVPANEWVHVAVSSDGSGKASGVRVYFNGKPQDVNVENDTLGESSVLTDVPFRVGQRSGGEPFFGGLQDLRIYRRSLSAGEVEATRRLSRWLALLKLPPAERGASATGTPDFLEYWLGSFDSSFVGLQAELERLQREESEIRGRSTIAHVMRERDELPVAWVLARGEYNQRLEQVSPGTPAVLPPFPRDVPGNRLGFAKWLLRPDQPLTARVTVNRFWQEVFGTGLVRSSGDFGIAGELPSHPELLDWLAVEFREGGWDVKQLFRLMVMSSTYRQAATVTQEKLERDPSNRFLSRGPRFRMDAEMVRDYALAVSGLLVNRLGGPSVKPYQPDGVWEAIAMNVSNTRSYQPDTGEQLYRRSLYTFIKRMAPPPSMEIFNAPNRELCQVRRERMNTPLQALVTLNDVQFVEAARALAQNLLRNGGHTAEERLQGLGQRALSRDFLADELQILRRSLTELQELYRGDEAAARQVIATGASPPDAAIDPVELAAWTMLCNEVLNLDEVLTK